MIKEINSIKQISDEMRRKKQEFTYMLNSLAIPNLAQQENLEFKFQTLSGLLKDVPQDSTLREMLEEPPAELPINRQHTILNYKGPYTYVKRAAQNINELKLDAQKLYYLTAQLGLNKIKNQLQQQPENNIKLKSFQILKNQNNKSIRHQKNSLAITYLADLKRQEQKSIINSNYSERIYSGESLIHISFYDSINGQKIFEYVCYGDQTLLTLAQTFYCMIAKLQNKEQHYHNSYFLIEQNFYYYGTQIKKKLDEIINFINSNQEQYLGQISNKINMKYQMDKTQLKNLRVVFGRPYLFRHLEGCDHIIIFKDLRLLTQNSIFDPIKKQKYPLAVFQGKMKRRKCEGCKLRGASIVSLNDALKNGKHLYLCDSCHDNLHNQNTDSSNMFIKYLHD